MTTLKELYNIALLRLDNNNLAGADSLLSQILAQAPSDVFAKHQLAKIALRQKQAARARELLLDVAAILDGNADVLIDLGRANTLSNNSADAIACLERACTLSPQNSEAYQYLAEAFFAIGRFGDAVRLAEQSIFISPANAEAHSILGDGFLEQGQVHRALDAYDESAKLNPDSWKVHANKGIAYIHLGDLERAKQCLALSNALNPIQPSVVLPLVSTLITLGQHTEAQAMLDRLHSILPGDARVQSAKGDNAFARGDSQAAIAAYINALSIDSENTGIQLKLADALSHGIMGRT
jgi:tetratricopeptide (TPR) repeat protein